MREKIIAIDFDGCIVSNAFPDIGILQPYAKEVINKLYLEHRIIINTCRSQNYENNCIKFLNNNEINYDWINHNDPDQILKYNADCRKISADLYIDDKCLMGLPMVNNMVDWLAIYRIIKNKLNGG